MEEKEEDLEVGPGDNATEEAGKDLGVSKGPNDDSTLLVAAATQVTNNYPFQYWSLFLLLKVLLRNVFFSCIC